MGIQETKSGQPSPAETQAASIREARVRQILEQTNAVLTADHFVYTSGKHGEAYVNKDAVYPDTEATRELCRMWAEDFQDKSIDVVVGPAMGAVILQNNTAFELTQLTRRRVWGVYAEKGPGDTFVISRGYDEFIRGKRVLVVEDVLTTGGSAKKTVDLIRELGGEVVGLGVICNRGGVRPEDIGVEEINALLNVSLNAWTEDECPLCEQGKPVNTKVGKGREFLQRKGVH